MPIWAHFDKVGWDITVYWRAIEALRAGHDPYASAMAVQTATHLNGGPAAGVDPPWSYVYSPITLPALHLIALVPGILSGALYWTLYVAAALLLVWVGMRAVEPDERPAFIYFAAVAPFFPGLLANGIILGGNIAFLLYAAAFFTAWLAWKGNTWLPFYLVVILASCVKAPLLCLVVLPILTARKQWIPAIAAGFTGAFLFGIQQWIWPDLFHHYLQAVELQFSYNRDFGCSLTGLLSGVLFDRGIAYAKPAAAFYLVFAAALFATLWRLSRLYLAGRITLSQYMPVLLVGVIQLNPRLIEYDVAPLAIPLALIGWRAIAAHTTRSRAIWISAITFLILNAAALSSWTLRKAMDGPLLVLFFAIGAHQLIQKAKETALRTEVPAIQTTA
jgi:hypothetical protein